MGIQHSYSQCSIILCTPSSSEMSTRLLDYHEPMISSMSLDGISISESLPLFPSTHRPPFFTLADLKDYPTTGNRDNQSLVTAPTAPRMRVVLEEKIVVNTWTATVNSQLAPPCHIPWEQGVRSPNGTEECERRLSRSLRLLRRVKDLADKPLDTLLVEKTATTPNHCGLGSGVLHIATETHKHITQQLEGKQDCTSSGSSVEAFNLLPSFSSTSCPRKRNLMTSEHMNLAVRRGHKAFPVLNLNSITTTTFGGPPRVDSSIIYQDQDFILSNLPQLISTRCRQELEDLRSSLPTHWFYRPLTANIKFKQPMVISRAPNSHSKRRTREWAFAEPLMDMIDDFSVKIDRLRNYNDIFRGNELTSRSSWRYQPMSTAQKYRSYNGDVIREVDGLLTNIYEAEWQQPRPCLVSSPRSVTGDMKPKKSVRFARLPQAWRQDSTTTTSDDESDQSLPDIPSVEHKHLNVTLLGGGPSLQLPPPQVLHPEAIGESTRVVTDLGPAADVLELPRSGHISDPSELTALPLIMRDETLPIKESFLPKETCPSPLAQPKVNELTNPSPSQENPTSSRSCSRSLTVPRSKKFNKAGKFSNHLASVAVPRPRRNENDVRREEGAADNSNRTRNHLKTPLRSIFTKLK